MKKSIITMILSAIIFVAGCGGVEDAEETAIGINRSGNITQVLKEDFPTESYDSEKLITSVTAQVDEYNNSVGQEQVTLKEADVKENKAVFILQYKTDEDYRKFNSVDFFSGSVDQAVKEGYAFAGDFLSAAGNKTEPGVLPGKCMEEQVLIIREPYLIEVPGEILYVSANVERLGEKQAKLQREEQELYEVPRPTTEAYGYVIYHK